MANTLNFGAGKWAAKAGSVLAYNDLNNNFKPLPFTFTRASTATRVNESGIIESVASGVPRIDFLDNADGHLLLEPSRTNLLTYSEDFSNAAWTKNNTTVSANQLVSPSGSTDADELFFTADNNIHSVAQTISVTSGTTYSQTYFVKNNGQDYVQIFTAGAGLNFSYYVNFDLTSGTISASSGMTGSILNYGNGWFRISATATSGATGNGNLGLGGISSSTSGYRPTYVGSGESIYIWGAQLEAGSYATSYIPTSGSSVTRAAEGTIQTPPSGIIGQTEGTFFLDFSSLSDSIVNEQVSLSDGTDNNTIKFVLAAEISGVQAEGKVSGINQFTIKKTTSDYDSSKKIAVAYKANDFVFYYNGEQIGVDTSGSIPSLSQIKFSAGDGTYPLYGNIKNLRLYDTRLSNSELAALTSL